MAEHLPESPGAQAKESHEASREYVENSKSLAPIPTQATYFNGATAGLTPAHKEYLIRRHGTFDLDPIPDMGDADPYNWPSWMKITNLVLVAIHSMMTTFTAASIIPAYENIVEDLGVSLQRVTYLTSLQIAILGVAPLLWKPFSNAYGRRPLFLISLVFSCVGNIGCAKSPSYNSMSVCRAIVAFFICPAAAIGSAVVTETFFKKERAKYMGIWTLMVTLGVPISPFIFGFVTYHTGNYRWIYWILAMINGVQFVVYIFFGPETRYIRSGVQHVESSFKQEYLTFKRIDPRPLTVRDFYHPLELASKPCILIPAIAYAMIFLFGSVLITVELPQLFGAKFGFNAQQLGLQFLGVIIGSVIGEQIGGSMSDWWMNRKTKKSGRHAQPEYRLWLSYSGFILTIVGVVVFLVRTQQAPEKKWNITPVIGIAIAGVGNQLVTTVLITYAVDCHHDESASIGVFITFVRQVWGFIGPFWFPDMFDNVGVAASAGVCAALIVGVSIFPTILVQWRGKHWRETTDETESEGTEHNGETKV